MARNTPEPPSPDWDNWPKLDEAAALIGISGRQLQKWVKTGKAERHQCPDGTFRYDPAHLRELQGLATDEREESEMSAAQLVGAMSAYLRTQNTHFESLVKALVDPIKENISSWKDQVIEARKRITELEAQQEQNYKDRERLLSEQQERDLMKQESEAKIKRQDMTLEVLKEQVLPAIVTSMKAKSGQAQAAVELLQSIEPETIDALLAEEVEFLTKEQKILLRTILNRPAKAATPTASAEPKQQENPNV
jgi:hypothetical protein